MTATANNGVCYCPKKCAMYPPPEYRWVLGDGTESYTSAAMGYFGFWLLFWDVWLIAYIHYGPIPAVLRSLAAVFSLLVIWAAVFVRRRIKGG